MFALVEEPNFRESLFASSLLIFNCVGERIWRIVCRLLLWSCKWQRRHAAQNYECFILFVPNVRFSSRKYRTSRQTIHCM